MLRSPGNMSCWYTGGVETRLYSFLKLAPEWGGWSAPRPGRCARREETLVFIAHETGWSPGPVWMGAKRKFLIPTGVKSPASSRYTNHAIPDPSVEWHWRWKSGVPGEYTVPMSLCPLKFPHGLHWDRIWLSPYSL